LGLSALIGQENLMSGRLSTVYNIVGNLAAVLALLASGPMTERLTPRQIFFLAAALMLSLFAFGFWKPSSVFSHAYDNPLARGSTFLGDVRRLVRHKAIYPALLINFLWFFNPGLNTPMQFHLTEHLHASDATYSFYLGAFIAAMIPMMFVYGFLCTRVPAKNILWWSTIVGVCQMIPLAFIRTADMAVPLAVLMGLSVGMAVAAYYELAMRSYPPSLQGTMMMLTIALGFISQRGSDLLGAKIYESSPDYGFLYCVIATTAVYLLILPTIPRIPKHLIATADGQPNPALDAALIP